MKSRNLYDAIYNRRSIRNFSSDPIPGDALQRIVESARWAPSGGNSQPWQFGVVREEQRKTALAEAAGGQIWIAEAPVVIALCCPLQRQEQFGEASQKVNRMRWGEQMSDWMTQCPDEYGVSLLLNNAAPHIPGAHIQLAAQAEGIGSCWIGYLDIDRASEILQLPHDWRCYYLIPLGYPDGSTQPPPRKPLSEITFAERWDEDLSWS